MDIEEEKKRQEFQLRHDDQTIIEVTDRIYKPLNPIEFNRLGEVVLYTCSPFKHKPLYNVYPYSLYEACIPACLYMFLMNPLNLSHSLSYSFIFMGFMLAFPRVWHVYSFNRRIERLSLLRGGKVLKFESSTIYGDRQTSWVHTKQMRPLTEDFMNFDDRDEAEFLDEKGDLKYELGIEADQYVFQGLTYSNENVFFMKEGIVHQPELFEAALKGYNIDTSDFTINTANNERAGEPNYNY
jgi:uncharacterized membrane protein YecN with MAPEG domain